MSYGCPIELINFLMYLFLFQHTFYILQIAEDAIMLFVFRHNPANHTNNTTEWNKK